jgi:predicted transcriptional regulator
MKEYMKRLKTRIPISSTIDKEIWERMQKLSEKTRINKSRLLDEAIEDLLKKYKM